MRTVKKIIFPEYRKTLKSAKHKKIIGVRDTKSSKTQHKRYSGSMVRILRNLNLKTTVTKNIKSNQEYLKEAETFE